MTLSQDCFVHESALVDEGSQIGRGTKIWHFYDMLGWVFGDVRSNKVYVHTHDRAAGFLEFDQARVRWFLSINADNLPPDVKRNGQRTYRSIQIEGEELEFSTGFTELHTESYKKILGGNGFSIADNKKAIQIVQEIRVADPIGLQGDYHPLANQKLSRHPFNL